MRIADFILKDIELILGEWEAFARSIWPGAATDPLTLRDHARDILRATALDMKSAQTSTEQSAKAKGEGTAAKHSERVDGASDVHAAGRVRSGFDLLGMVAEYRALRASVIRLWRESSPNPDVRDIDDLTRFNESIDQSLTEAIRSYTQVVDRSREMFLAILGHDLRGPLNSISMSAQLLGTMEVANPEARSVTSVISKSSAAMAGMISDLLDFTGSRLGVAMPLTVTTISLKKVCDEVIAEIQAAHPDRTIQFLMADASMVEGDANRLRQVIANLLGNAVQHGIPTKSIDLSLVCADGDLVLTVHNAGKPIPEASLATIFNPMVRGTSTEAPGTRQPGSIGLGLYIAQEIVIAHNGSIKVESTEDAGTTFTIRLPLPRAGGIKSNAKDVAADPVQPK